MTAPVKTQWTGDTILAFLHAHADELQQMGVVRIGLFGSYVRGEQTPDSDIDVLVTMRDATWRSFVNVQNFLEDHLRLPIDLGEEDTLRPELQPIVMREVRYAEGFNTVSS